MGLSYGVNPEKWMHEIVEHNIKLEVKDIPVEINSIGYSNNILATTLMKYRLKKFRYKLVKKNK